MITATNTVSILHLEDEPRDARLIHRELTVRRHRVLDRQCRSRSGVSRRDCRRRLRHHPGRPFAAGLQRHRGAEDRARAVPQRSVHLRLGIARRGAGDRGAQERRHRLRAQASADPARAGGQARAPGIRRTRQAASGGIGGGRARRSAAPFAEARSGRPAGRRHRARLQQPADRDQRLLRAPAPDGRRHRSDEGRSRADPQGRTARGRPDAPVARVQPPAGAAAEDHRAQRHRHRHRAHPQARHRRAGRGDDGARSGARRGAGRPGTDRAGHHEPRHQRARRDAGRRRADHRDRERHHRREGRAALSAAPRTLRHAGGARFGHRHGRGHRFTNLRTVLHDQGSGQGHRSRPVDGLRHRHAERRRSLRGERPRTGHDHARIPAEHGGCGRAGRAAAGRSAAPGPRDAAARRGRGVRPRVGAGVPRDLRIHCDRGEQR